MIGGEWKVWCVALIYLKKIIVYLYAYSRRVAWFPLSSALFFYLFRAALVEGRYLCFIFWGWRRKSKLLYISYSLPFLLFTLNHIIIYPHFILP